MNKLELKWTERFERTESMNGRTAWMNFRTPNKTTECRVNTLRKRVDPFKSLLCFYHLLDAQSLDGVDQLATSTAGSAPNEDGWTRTWRQRAPWTAWPPGAEAEHAEAGATPAPQCAYLWPRMCGGLWCDIGARWKSWRWLISWSVGLSVIIS